LSSDIGEWRITFADTGLYSNIGERLAAVRQHLDAQDYFLATYGDAVTDAPLAELVAGLVDADKIATFLCVRPTSYSFHTVALTQGVVTRIQDVTEADIWINGGFFVFRSDIFDYIEDGEDLVAEPFERLIERKLLLAHRYEGFWAPMDTLKDKHNLEAMLESGRAPWEIWDAAFGSGRKASF
jgi:glucose-1-phosphate cytidylyltransferase